MYYYERIKAGQRDTLHLPLYLTEEALQIQVTQNTASGIRAYLQLDDSTFSPKKLVILISAFLLCENHGSLAKFICKIKTTIISDLKSASVYNNFNM